LERHVCRQFTYITTSSSPSVCHVFAVLFAVTSFAFIHHCLPSPSSWHDILVLVSDNMAALALGHNWTSDTKPSCQHSPLATTGLSLHHEGNKQHDCRSSPLSSTRGGSSAPHHGQHPEHQRHHRSKWVRGTASPIQTDCELTRQGVGATVSLKDARRCTVTLQRAQWTVNNHFAPSS
jgi:hypothetical protein